MLEIYGVFSQLKEMKRMRSNVDAESAEDDALSVFGLKVQAIVFAVVAVTWIWRVPIEKQNGTD